MDDDLWADDGDDDAGRKELSREWDVRNETFYNSGYREGLEAGKALTVQEGFNKGFAQGGHAGFQWGAARGAVKTLEVLSGQVAGTSNLKAKVAALAKQLEVPALQAMQQVCEAVLEQRWPASQDAGTQPPTGEEAERKAESPESLEAAGQVTTQGEQTTQSPEPSTNISTLTSDVSSKLSDMGFTLPQPPPLPPFPESSVDPK